ncbi:MAG: hypothetical protein O6922_05160, partial [Chloroflexi bacterium]|nr:hypothetical protein [Chloroflexota bacterium]
EADHSSGDLTEIDFNLQRNQLRVTAAELLRDESGPYGPIKDREEQLEREISRMRERSISPTKGGDQE